MQEATLLESLSLLPEQEQLAFLSRMNWLSTARPKQITPEGDWFIWILLAGRGFGKSRTASEDLAQYTLSHPGERIAVVAATTNDLRKVCFEGDSGILN